MTTDDRGFVDVMRDNAIPITLIGIGTAWLLASTTGVADRVANDDRVHAARRRISELAGNAGLASGTREPRGGSILGPDGKPLSRAGEDYEGSWVHQAAGAAKNVITSVRDAGSAFLDRAGSASEFAGRARIRLAISYRPIPGSSVPPAWLPVRFWQRCYHLPGSSRTTLGRRVTTS
jgi:hypothetical protein